MTEQLTEEQQHSAFCSQVVMNTNGCCVAVLFVFTLPSWPALLALLGWALVLCYNIVQFRKADRRYKQAVEDHMKAGGMVMMVKRGRRWEAIPMPIYRDPS